MIDIIGIEHIAIAVNKFEYIYLEDEKDIENILSRSYNTENVYGKGHFIYYKNMLDVSKSPHEVLQNP